MTAREGACCTHLRFDLTEMAGGNLIELHVLGEPEVGESILRETVPLLFPSAAESCV